MKSDARVLIIDDNVNLARGFAMALGRAGYDVCLAHTADDGLKLAGEHPPDAILLDFRMPFVNGVGFLYRLRELPGLHEVPVMVITGETVNQETLADLHDLNASLRFKPLPLSQLLEETRALLATRELTQAECVTAQNTTHVEGGRHGPV